MVEIKNLRTHEKVNFERVKKLIRDIRKDRKIKKPIIVDKKTRVILDGHHRYTAAKIIGMKKIPAVLVNYRNPEIKLYPRRDIEVSKEDVLNRGVSNTPYPFKTTMHIIPFLIENVDEPIGNLF